MADLVPGFSTSYLRKRHPIGQLPLALPYHCHREEKPPSPDGGSGDLAFLLLEGLGVRDIGVVGTTLDAKDSPEDSEVRNSELVVVNRLEGPRHTLVQQGLNHLGLQHADLQGERDGRHVV